MPRSSHAHARSCHDTYGLQAEGSGGYMPCRRETHGYKGVIGEEVREIGPDFQTLGSRGKKHWLARRRPVTLEPQSFHAVPFDCRASRFFSCSFVVPGSESLCSPNSTLHPRNH